jgi:hypothetical protein
MQIDQWAEDHGQPPNGPHVEHAPRGVLAIRSAGRPCGHGLRADQEPLWQAGSISEDGGSSLRRPPASARTSRWSLFPWL